MEESRITLAVDDIANFSANAGGGALSAFTVCGVVLRVDVLAFDVETDALIDSQVGKSNTVSSTNIAKTTSRSVQTSSSV